MEFPHINFLAVLVSGVIIFILGGLWYSPVLFAKKWIALMKISEEDMKKAAASSNMPLMYGLAFVCGLLVSLAMAFVIGRIREVSVLEGALHGVIIRDVPVLQGALLGVICWLGFAGATSFATAIFSMQDKRLWLINSGYNLVSFVIAGVLLAAWR